MKIRIASKLLSVFALASALVGMAASPAAAASAVSPAERPTHASCTSQQMGRTQACPLPIKFARGSYGALVNGTITTTSYTRYYSLSAKANQQLTITFTGAGDMRGSIMFPNGSGDGPYYGAGQQTTLPVNGVYIIQVGANTMAGNPWNGRFTMAVLVN